MIRFTNTKDFQKKLEEFAKRAEINLAIVAKRMAFAAYRSIIEKTPVDTGRARASWNISEGSIDASVQGTRDFKGGGGIKKAKVVNQQKLDKIKSSIVKYPVYYITNNLPYIVPLEEGHSKQADKGWMVKRTIVQLGTELDELLEGLRK